MRPAPVALAILLVSALTAEAGTSPADLVREVKRQRSAPKRAEIVKQIAALGDKAQPALLGAWKTADERSAVDFLLLIERLKTEEARADLILATRSRLEVVRRTAAEGLGNYRHRDTEEALFRLVRDRDLPVALAALESLNNLRSSSIYKPLLRQIRRYGDEPHSLRFKRMIEIVQGLLEETHDLEIVAEICRLAGREAPEDQKPLLLVLSGGEAKVAPPILREVLREYLEGENYEGEGFGVPLKDVNAAENLRPLSADFAEIALRGLGLARDKDSAELMIAALEHPLPRIRLAALQVVHLALPKGPKIPVPTEDAEETPSAGEDFQPLRKKAIRSVIIRLSDRARGIRSRAYVWLKRETQQRSLPPTYAKWKAWFEGYFGAEEDTDEDYEDSE